MSTIINRVYASAGTEVIIDTLEITSEAWPTGIYITRGYADVAAVTEDARTLTFIAAPITVALPKKSNEANQTLKFAIDNVTGEAQRLIDLALIAEAPMTLTFRRYLNTDLTAPAEPPFFATVLGGGVKGSTVQIDAGFYDLLNYAWPRDTYNLNFAPGLKYL
jgi:hypothetical protein